MTPESGCGNARESGCARLESGAAFMPGVSEKRLEKAARREKDQRAKFRLLVCLARKRGHSIRRISRDLKTPYSTIRDWLLRMRGRGLKGRFNARPKGRRAGLPLQILRTVRRWLKRSPKRCGFQTGSWRLDMVNEMIRRETGRHTRPRTLRRILRRLGLSYSKPRPVPRKTAPTEEQDMFKESVKRTILGVSGHGYAVLAVDEAGVMRGASPGYGWRQAKSRDEVRTGFSTKAIRLFGALGRDRIHVKAVERTNSETFVEFLRELRQEYGRLVILLDNASYHRYKAVDEFVRSTCGDIKLAYLPPYTPQLNPIEIQWRVLKEMLTGRYFESTDGLVGAITDLIDSGQMRPVRLMKYLAH